MFLHRGKPQVFTSSFDLCSICLRYDTFKKNILERKIKRSAVKSSDMHQAETNIFCYDRFLGANPDDRACARRLPQKAFDLIFIDYIGHSYIAGALGAMRQHYRYHDNNNIDNFDAFSWIQSVCG